MARTFQDRNLQLWEAFANTGEHGFPEAATIVFRCQSSRDVHPRYLTTEGDTAEAEARVQTLSNAELLEMLNSALPLD